MATRGLAAGALLLGLGVSAGCRPEERRTTPRGHAVHVFLVVLDAASAAYFGTYGDPHGTSPNIDRLARDSVVFDNAYSQSPTTTTSTVSLLTGIRVRAHLPALPTIASSPDVPGLLRTHGFDVFAIVANPRAYAPGSSFDAVLRVWAGEPRRAGKEPAGRLRIPRPGDVNRAFSELLPRLVDPAGPRAATFTYIHYLQPHTPYDPPPRYVVEFDPRATDEGTATRRRWWWLGARLERANRTGKASRATIQLLESRYRANIRYVDAAVGALVDRLRREGLYRDALLILTADHGDAFFKHGRFGHNATLYDDMTRIPLVMKFPTRDRIVARRVPDLVETIDVPATLCDYLGIPAPAGIEGDSLWPLVRGDARALAHPEVVIATRDRDQHAVRLGDRKYIRHDDGREELYDLGRDPDEQHDLAREEAGTARTLRETLARVMGATPESPARRGEAPVTPETRRLLEALGYVDEGRGDGP